MYIHIFKLLEAWVPSMLTTNESLFYKIFYLEWKWLCSVRYVRIDDALLPKCGVHGFGSIMCPRCCTNSL